MLVSQLLHTETFVYNVAWHLNLLMISGIPMFAICLWCSVGHRRRLLLALRALVMLMLAAVLWRGCRGSCCQRPARVNTSLDSLIDTQHRVWPIFGIVRGRFSWLQSWANVCAAGIETCSNTIVMVAFCFPMISGW